MTVQVIEKRKGATVCGGCGDELTDEVAKSQDFKCSKCGSEDVKKSIILVRKAVGDTEEEAEDALDDVEVEEEEDELDDDDEVDDDDLDDDDEEEEEEEEDDEEDEEDDEEDDEDDDAPPPGVKKSYTPLRAAEVLNLSTALAEDIVKVLNGEADYESVMVEFNDVMDAAAESWLSGANVSKSSLGSHRALITERVNGIMGTKKIKKSHDDPYAGLPAEVRKSLENADKIVEERETEKWLEVAKGYSHFPGDKVELAKSLRTLHETDEDAYKVMKATLDAGQHNLEQGDIFKRFGENGEGETDEVKKRRSAAQELVSKGEFKTIEQAEVHLMNGENYKPTNVAN